MPFRIDSPQNPHIKATIRLEKRAARDERRVTRVEGMREVQRALEVGVVPVEAYVCTEVATGPEATAAIARLEALDRERRTRLHFVSSEAYARIAVREESGGIVLVVPYSSVVLDDVPLSTNPFLCVVEGVEKPGNLGAILRTSDGAGVDAVIVAEGVTDLHNPNVIRASLGAYFTIPVCEASATATRAYLRARGIGVVVADPAGERIYTDVDYAGPVAVILGAEDRGLSEAWKASADARVRIPMRGRIDSLNLATASALLLYEVVRQRGK